MTVRAVIFGLIGATIIAGVAYINDYILEMASLLAGHLVSVGVFMFILVGGAFILLLRLGGRTDRIRPGEIAVVMTLMMAGCGVAVSGLLETFTPALVMPMHYTRTLQGWKKHNILQYAPPSMLPGDGKWEDPTTEREVVEDFLGAKGKPGQPISLSQVPWQYWQRCLVTWLPLIALAGIAMTCMALIVHRQWAHRERLRYPIAEVASSLISGRTVDQRPLFRNRAFWLGFAVVFSIHLINGYYRWNSSSIQIPLSFDFGQILQKWPILQKAEWSGNLVRPMINFTAVAFSFFLASDIALSLGISQLIYVPLSALMVTVGMDIKSDYMAGGLSAFQRFGGFMAFALILLYIGRNYYRHLFVRAFTFKRTEGVSSYEAWALRILTIATLGMMFIIWRLGLNIPMTIMLVGMVLITYLTVARISAETGLFFIQPRWQSLGVLLGLFGYLAFGPEAIVIVGLTCVVLSFDPSQSLMPYFINGLRTCDWLKVKPGRVGIGVGVVFVISLLVGVTAVLWANYNWPLTQHNFFTKYVPQSTFQTADKAVTALENSGHLKESLGLSGWERLVNMDPKPQFLWAAGVGFGMVLLLSVLRLRFTWWPIHPVFLLVWGTWPMARLSQSFFLGWLIKVIITRLGGGSAYRATKPLMIGVIAGDLLGAGIWELYGWIYYGFRHIPPASYWVFPH